jgi:two-component system, LytTR family, response regulator
MNCVKAYNKGGSISLNDATEIELSPTYKEEFLKNFR